MALCVPLQSEIESQPEVDASLVEVACKTAASAAEKEHHRQQGKLLGSSIFMTSAHAYECVRECRHTCMCLYVCAVVPLWSKQWIGMYMVHV